MGTEVARRSPMQDVLATVASDGFLAKLENALPEGVTPKRFASVAVAAIKGSPELIAADRESLYNSIVRCAQDGLMPDSKEAALVIYRVKGKDVVRYMPMIGGYRRIAAKHGIVIVADVVREGDEFDYSKVPPRLTHKPAPLGKERGEIIGAYAVAYRGDRLVAAPEVMEPEEIEKVRAVSRTATSEYGPWVNWWDRMAAKTVARRLFGQLPLAEIDEQTSRVIAASDEEFDLPSPEPRMTEAEANAAVAAGAGQRARTEQQLRDEPEAPTNLATDAQLNRIAQLEEQVDDEPACKATLIGLFGAQSPAELSPEDAERYEGWLTQFLEQREEPQVVEGDAVEYEDEDGIPVSFKDMLPADVKTRQEQKGEQQQLLDEKPEPKPKPKPAPRRRRASS